MGDERTPIGFLEATVRIPIFEGDHYEGNGPGDWWEYAQPGVAKGGVLGTCRRKVTEVSRRLILADGKTEGDPLSGKPSAVVSATYVSVWDGGTQVRSPCKFNTDTRKAFDVESADADEGLTVCEREYVELPDGRQFDRRDDDEADDGKTFILED